MRETADSYNINMNRLADTTDFIQNNSINISFLQDQISSLRLKLKHRVDDYGIISRDINTLQDTVGTFEDFKASLYIR